MNGFIVKVMVKHHAPWKAGEMIYQCQVDKGTEYRMGSIQHSVGTEDAFAPRSGPEEKGIDRIGRADMNLQFLYEM